MSYDLTEFFLFMEQEQNKLQELLKKLKADYKEVTGEEIDDLDELKNFKNDTN